MCISCTIKTDSRQSVFRSHQWKQVCYRWLVGKLSWFTSLLTYLIINRYLIYYSYYTMLSLLVRENFSQSLCLIFSWWLEPSKRSEKAIRNTIYSGRRIYHNWLKWLLFVVPLMLAHLMKPSTNICVYIHMYILLHARVKIRLFVSSKTMHNFEAFLPYIWRLPKRKTKGDENLKKIANCIKMQLCLSLSFPPSIRLPKI